MASLTLVVGNKNYSSWSLRPWLDSTCQAYGDALLALPSLLEWEAAAEQEPWINTSYSNPAPASNS